MNSTIPVLAALTMLAGTTAAWSQGGTAGATPPARPAAVSPPTSSAQGALVRVLSDEVDLKAGASAIYYPVARLKKNTILRSDGEDAGFVRVAYPEGVSALVRAGDVQEDGPGKLKLTRPSRLMARNVVAGHRGSFSGLMDRELPAGTVLTAIETIKGDDGKPVFYSIVPPDGARGYVVRGAVVRLTADEIARLPGAGAVGASGSAPTAPQQSPTANTPPASNQSSGNTAGGTLPPPPASSTPQPGSNPANPTPPAPTPPDANPAPGDQPAPTEMTPPPPPPPAPPVVNKLDELRAMYDRVRKQPLEQAELDEAIKMFQDHIATLGPSAGDQRQAKVLGQFVTLMEIRRDTRKAMAERATANSQIEQQRKVLLQTLADLERQQLYRVIGRLVTSEVYDGTTRPKLFRIVSPEPGVSRTLAYIVPQDGLDLPAKVGRVVGVVGSTRVDEALRAALITPTRVDVVALVPATSSSPSGSGAPPAPPANPAAPASTPSTTAPASGG